MWGGGREPKILEEPCIAASRGRDKSNSSDKTKCNDNLEQRLELNKDGLCNTLTSVQKDNYAIEPKSRIRKLTELECFRLMGFTDEQYFKAVEAYDKAFGLRADGTTKSGSQMYKRAGNSIVVKVIEHIMENLFYQRKQPGNQISLF